MVLGIEDFVFDSGLLEHAGDQFGSLDRNRTDQDRLALGIEFLHFFQKRIVFGFLGAENQIRIIDSGNRLIGRDLHDPHIVDGKEFFFLGLCRTGHAGQLIVKTEEVLIGDRRPGRCLLFDRNAFLGLNRLMQTIRVFSARHLTAGVLIDDDDFIVFHDIFDISGHDVVGLQGLGNIMNQRSIVQIVEILHIEGLLAFMDALFRELNILVFDIDDVIFVFLQSLDEAVRIDVEVGSLLFAAGNDERCP